MRSQYKPLLAALLLVLTTDVDATGVRGVDTKKDDRLLQFLNLDFFDAEQRGKEKDKDVSEDDCEKMWEKHGIACAPSAEPSSAPTLSPTISHAPTISPAPTVTPTRAPVTAEPSAYPTGAPSGVPTWTPTGAPSFRPTRTPYANLLLTREDGSIVQENTCQTPLPAGASDPQIEIVEFEYFLQVSPGTNPDSHISEIEQALTTSLAEEMLTCENDSLLASSSSVSRQSNNAITVPSFSTYGISSLPMDARSSSNNCPEDMNNSTEYSCFAVHAGFTPTIFYRSLNTAGSNSNNNDDNGNGLRRQLQLTETQQEIVQVYGPVLQNFLDSGMFNSAEIVNTAYSGFLFPTSNVHDQVGADGTISNISNQQATDEGSGGGSGSANAPMYGGIAVGLAAVALAMIAILLVQRRKKNALSRNYDEKLDDSGDISFSEASADAARKIPVPTYDQNSTVDVIGFEVDYVSTYRDFDGQRSVQSQSLASGKSLREFSSQAGLEVVDLKYDIVKDEATIEESLYGGESHTTQNLEDPHDYINCRLESCFKCRNRSMPQPVFVKADLRAIQSDLGHNKRYQPKYDTRYAVKDTVSL